MDLVSIFYSSQCSSSLGRIPASRHFTRMHMPTQPQIQADVTKVLSLALKVAKLNFAVI